MVEVLERMFTLAARRLSMIALGRRRERRVVWMDGDGAHGKREKRQMKTSLKPQAVDQTHQETEAFKRRNLKENSAFSSTPANILLHYWLGL